MEPNSDDGRIMLRSSDFDRRSAQEAALDAGHSTPQFHHPDVLAQIESKRSGYVQNDGALLGWQRLHVQGWSFVVETEPL